MEGVHLRFGPVARGGLRWSDRREDFRTEVLGLVKAQQVKNAVIVPVGAKGGFYPEAASRGGTASRSSRPRASPPTRLDPRCCSTSPTTRRLAGRAAGRRGAHDGDDPYLVVAADKGTATFSDIANAHRRSSYGFWLDDAFASGGSAGYDHKKMGITARGAWEAVKRHFREMAATSRRRRSPSSALATCRATCSATACCCRQASKLSPPSTIATSSSIPIPRIPPFPCRAKAHVRAAALLLAGLRQEACSPGGGDDHIARGRSR
jgi:hypothetical protein